MGFGRVRVTTAVTKILSANPQRQSLILTNASTSGIVFLGSDNTVTSAHAATQLAAGGITTKYGDRRRQ